MKDATLPLNDRLQVLGALAHLMAQADLLGFSDATINSLEDAYYAMEKDVLTPVYTPTAVGFFTPESYRHFVHAILLNRPMPENANLPKPLQKTGA